MSEVERLRKALEYVRYNVDDSHASIRRFIDDVLAAEPMPPPPESRDTPPPAFGEWHDARYPKPRAIKGTVALMEWGERRAYRQTGWDAAVLRCGIAGVAASGAAGATTAAAQEKS